MCAGNGVWWVVIKAHLILHQRAVVSWPQSWDLTPWWCSGCIPLTNLPQSCVYCTQHTQKEKEEQPLIAADVNSTDGWYFLYSCNIQCYLVAIAHLYLSMWDETFLTLSLHDIDLHSFFTKHRWVVLWISASTSQKRIQEQRMFSITESI